MMKNKELQTPQWLEDQEISKICKIFEKDQTVLVIFGATGDLTHRKLLPAIYNLCYEAMINGCKIMPWSILAIGRRNWDKEQYRDSVKSWIEEFARKEVKEEFIEQFLENIDYYQMDISDVNAYQGMYEFMVKNYEGKERIYYYAVAPRFFEPISEGLKSLPKENSKGKVIIEKPFGEDINQAKKLHESIAKVMGQENVYAIDHYLGKEMIQNIYTIRFGNMLFQNSWNKEAIESIEITASEELGIGTRGGYYDKSGAMRDMVQNHLFQILSLLTMEEPKDSSFKSWAMAQSEVLKKLRTPTIDQIDRNLVLGQYEGYLEEDQVNPQSKTETYVAMTVYIDNERWQDVPIFIRTGKKLGKRSTFVVINYKKTMQEAKPNRLIIEIQPQEGVKFNFNIKKAGLSYQIEPVSMNFCQSCQIQAHMNTPEAYERLLQAAKLGQRHLFSQWPQIESSWRYVDEIMKLKDEANLEIQSYKPGSNGPKKADEMLENYKSSWYDFI